jgi:hypothetical protein
VTISWLGNFLTHFFAGAPGAATQSATVLREWH